MQRYKILHRTYYNFSGAVTLGPHHLRLRPREDYDLHIESLNLKITPPATLLWHRDVEGNSVATATFDVPANQLVIESEVIIQQFNEAPLDFLVADYAVAYPFTYQPDDRIMLLPYMAFPEPNTKTQLTEWIAGFWQSDEPIQTYYTPAAAWHPHQPNPVLSSAGRTWRSNCGANTGIRHRLMP